MGGGTFVLLTDAVVKPSFSPIVTCVVSLDSMQRMGVDAVGGDAAAEGRGPVKAAAAGGARRRRRLQCAARGEFWVIAKP